MSEYLTPAEVDGWVTTEYDHDDVAAATLRKYAEIVEAVAKKSITTINRRDGAFISAGLILRARRVRGYE